METVAAAVSEGGLCGSDGLDEVTIASDHEMPNADLIPLCHT